MAIKTLECSPLANVFLEEYRIHLKLRMSVLGDNAEKDLLTLFMMPPTNSFIRDL